ncbi:D-alanyl-D-alanine carboxypeptidase family protein [bacterium]|nr:D-alanyl-D-alanine carboxypeptidase family protein [bacterium]
MLLFKPGNLRKIRLIVCLGLLGLFISGVEAADFALAAKKNAALQKGLNWSFGGQTQHGWYLYTSLIQRTIHTEAMTDSTDFAKAISNWQKQNGLPADGILNHETWMKMVSVYQSDRLSGANRSQVFTGLETVSSSYFYDPLRSADLRKVGQETLSAYHKMVAAAKKDLSRDVDFSKNWLKIISAYRTPAYQAQLRKQSPNASRAALGINSPHFTGRALDLYVGGIPVGTDDHNRAIQVNTAVYQWLVKNADRFGFKPYFYEPWHWEYNPTTFIAQAPYSRRSLITGFSF